MPTYLHQIVALERGVLAETEKKLAEIRHVLEIGGDRNPLTGLSRTYRPRQEDGETLPEENRKVQLTVPELVGYARDQLAKLFDVKLAREGGNTEARADVVVDGEVLLAAAPAGYLLFLETQITQLITQLIDKLPTLDPAEDWKAGDPLPEHVWASAPRQTSKSRKVPQAQVLWEPTVEQIRAGYQAPVQIRQFDTDVIAGDWTMVKFSGELPVREQQEMRARAVKALEAVKRAREQANRLEIAHAPRAQVLLGYILGS